MKNTKPTVEICVWETRGNDPCVFVARTKKRLYKAVWDVIKDYWAEEVSEDEKPPKDPSEALDVYIKKVTDNECGEYFTFSTQEIL